MRDNICDDSSSTVVGGSDKDLFELGKVSEETKGSFWGGEDGGAGLQPVF